MGGGRTGWRGEELRRRDWWLRYQLPPLLQNLLLYLREAEPWLPVPLAVDPWFQDIQDPLDLNQGPLDIDPLMSEFLLLLLYPFLLDPLLRVPLEAEPLMEPGEPW